MENELESLRSEVRSWKRKAESGNITMEGDHQLRTYKKKVEGMFPLEATGICDSTNPRGTCFDFG